MEYGEPPLRRGSRQERPRAAPELRDRILAGLADLARAATEGLDLPAYLEQLCDTVAAVLGTPQVRVWQLDGGRTHLELAAQTTLLADPGPQSIARRRSLAGAVLAQGKLLEVLRYAGKYENTVIIYISVSVVPSD